MATRVPDETIKAFARTIHQESSKYGFSPIDTVRLINALMDIAAEPTVSNGSFSTARSPRISSEHSVERFPLESERLLIRRSIAEQDSAMMEAWMQDEYGKHFLLSCSTAQQLDIDQLLTNPKNQVGIIELHDGTPIGATAFLDIDSVQRRAELRKVIGNQDARGMGYAEEATSLWIQYGLAQLHLEKIFVSTLQTHIRNIQLNESVGFRVEGVLRGEVRLGSERHDVLRMGLCA